MKLNWNVVITALLFFITTGCFAQVWVQKASCPFGAFEPGFYFSHDNGNKIYVAKVSSTGADSIIYYNTLTDSWHYYGLFPGSAKISSAICINDKAYVFSGRSCLNNAYSCFTNEVWELNLSTNVWTQKTTLFPNNGRAGHSLVYNPSTNKIYINFGETVSWNSNSSLPLTDSFIYDITSDSYILMQSFSISGSGRFGHTAYSSGNFVYVYWGGSNVSPSYTYGNNLIYNISSNTWSATGTPVQRKYGVTFELGGAVYVGMGYVGGDPVTQNTDFYAITPLNTSIPPFPGTPFYKGLSVACGGKGYLGLGSNLVSGFEPAPRTSLNQLWQFNPLVLSLDKDKDASTKEKVALVSSLVDKELIFDTNSDYFDVTVKNTLGQTHITKRMEGTKTLNVENLNSGVYYLTIHTLKGNGYTYRIIKT